MYAGGNRCDIQCLVSVRCVVWNTFNFHTITIPSDIICNSFSTSKVFSSLDSSHITRFISSHFPSYCTYRDSSRIALIPLVCLLILPCVVSAQGQEALGSVKDDDAPLAPGIRRTFKAVRTATPPEIDGRLDESIWDDAEVLGDFIDTRTDDFVNEPTTARLLYDDDFIYVYWECFQDPETINATERKDDRFEVRFEDYVQVGFDTFHDGKWAYIFLVSPLGTKWDARDGVFERNQAWDAVWQAETQITEEGWTAEMAIPIGVMYRNSSDSETWGVNFRRRYTNDNSSQMWNYDPNAGVPSRVSGPKFIEDFGVMTDLDLSTASVSRKPEWEAFVSSTTDRRQGGNTHQKFGGGFDLTMRLSTKWVTNFSVTPDFSEVDADNGDIQNRDTDRFLFENRSFFNEGAELFESPINIYDSRNITDIDVAAKIIGTGEGWTLASLVLDGEGTRSGDGRILVTRYSQAVTDNAQLGAMVIGVDKHEGYNVVTGLDARIELTPTTIWTSQYLYMFDRKPVLLTDEDGDEYEEIQQLSEHGFLTELSGGTKPFFWELSFTDISEGFRPDLAFIPRLDIIGPKLELDLDLDVLGKYLEAIDAQFEFEYYQNHAGDTTLRDFSLFTRFQFQNNYDFGFWIMEDYHKPFDNRSNQISLRYNRQNRFKSYELDFTWGKFQEVRFEQIDWAKPFKIGDRFTSEFSGTYRRESPHDEDDRDVWLWRLESEYTFVWEGRVKMTLEESSDDSYSRTLLFAYEDVKDWDFFVVLSDVGDENGETRKKLFTKFAYRF